MRRLVTGLAIAGILFTAAPTFGSAPAHSGTLRPDFCHVWEFSGGGTFNAAVTHSHRQNDIYQIVCEPGGEVCWAFSFNIGNGGTVLTTGLVDDFWEWWVCAWADNQGKTKYQAIASLPGFDLGRRGSLGEPREVDLQAADAPAAVLELSDRMTRQGR